MRGDAFQVMGQGGWEIIDSGTVPGRQYRWLTVLMDGTEFETLTGNNINSTGLANVPLPAGFPIGGQINEFSLLAGKVIAYYL